MTADRGMRAMLRQAGDGMGRALRRLSAYQLPDGLEDEMVEWVAHLRVSRALSVRTVENYLAAVAGFALWLQGQGYDLDTATPRQVEAWMQHLYVQAAQKSKTRGLKLIAVRRFYSWRLASGRATSNPAADIQGPKRDKPLPKKYSEAQLRALFGACDLERAIGVRDYAILMMLYSTGARRAELESLNLSQLTLREKSGSVQFHGKGAKERVVPFGKSCLSALERWLHERDKLPAIYDEDAVWLGLAGHSIGKRFKAYGLYQVAARAVRRAGLKISGSAGVHRMRVTFATDLYDSGAADLEAIQYLLGHEDIRTTRGYLAISDRRQKIRMPESQIEKITGKGKPLPLWAQHKQREREGGSQSE